MLRMSTRSILILQEYNTSSDIIDSKDKRSHGKMYIYMESNDAGPITGGLAGQVGG